MLKRVEPERIICYHTPFPEMEGNIIYVDYELSSWKHQNDDYVPSKYLPYIRGEKPLPENSVVVVKSGYVLRDAVRFKGMGSANGGAWKPKKEEDERFSGEPGEIKITQSVGKKGGYLRETKTGEDGRGIRERHHTDHGNSGNHTNPHDHIIDWSTGVPKPKPPTNYPDGASIFKYRKGVNHMKEIIIYNTAEENHFESISDFKYCIEHGGEVEFEWKEKTFGVWPQLKKTPDSPLQMLISQVYIENMELTEKWCDTSDEVLEYMVAGDRLRDVITQVEVLDRTI